MTNILYFRPPLQYATLDELIDKLVFLAVTDDGESVETPETDPVLKDIAEIRSRVYRTVSPRLSTIRDSSSAPAWASKAHSGSVFSV